MENKVEDVERVGLLAAGKNELIKHLEGNRLTQKQAINAKCYAIYQQGGTYDWQ